MNGYAWYNLISKITNPELCHVHAGHNQDVFSGASRDSRERANDLGLKVGDQFVVVARNGVVVLQGIEKPSMKDFDALIQKPGAGKKAKLTRSVAAAVVAARGRK